MGFGTPVPLLIGIVLILFGIGLFFLDTFKPGYKRDSDTVYAILFMLAGLFALLSWQADFQIAMQFMISAGALVALMIERIRNRSVLGNDPMQQGSGRPSRRESERSSRPPRSAYEDSPRSEVRAEFDDEPLPMEEPSRVRRIRGGREGSSNRDPYQSAYLDQLSEDTREPRRTSGRRASSAYNDEPQYSENPPRSRRRSPLQLEGDIEAPGNGSRSYNEERPERSETTAPSSGRRRGRSNTPLSSESEVTSTPRSARRRTRTNGDRPQDGDYVDYKPLGSPKPPSGDDDFDNSGNFDDSPKFR